jgi:hypothetical protein
MTKTNLKGELGGMTVYHNPNGIAKVLSLKSVAEKHRFTYDSWDRNGVFKVHTKDGVVEFKPSERGLHYVYVSVEGDVVQHMLLTANISEEEYDKEAESVTKECIWSPRSGEISKVIQGKRLRRPKKLEDFKE